MSRRPLATNQLTGASACVDLTGPSSDEDSQKDECTPPPSKKPANSSLATCVKCGDNFVKEGVAQNSRLKCFTCSPSTSLQQQHTVQQHTASSMSTPKLTAAPQQQEIAAEQQEIAAQRQEIAAQRQEIAAQRQEIAAQQQNTI
eukprot:COSAG02_NODE_18543_length_933_cov_1.330935_1_plen_143_part_01